MNAVSPLLSVCIPTFNRSAWLRASLAALGPQAQAAGADRVEIVVSDNASTDDTARVARELSETYGLQDLLRFCPNTENIGFMRNMLRCARDLARGKWVWLLGDDDLMHNGALARVLDVLAAHPEMNYVYANYAAWVPAAPPEPSEALADLLAQGTPRQPDLADHSVPDLQAVAAGDMNCFTPIYCSVWRRPLAAAAFAACEGEEPFSTPASVFPHALYVARHLLHQPAYYLGTPCVTASENTSWSRFWPITALELVPRLYDELERAGIPPSVMDDHRRSLLKVSEGALRVMLTDPNVPRRAQFSLIRFLRRAAGFPEGRRLAALALWVLMSREAQRARRLGGRILRRLGLRRPLPPADSHAAWLTEQNAHNFLHPSLEWTGDPNGWQRITLGSEVRIERDVTLWMSPDVGADARLSLGRRCFVGRSTYIGIFQPVTIGANALVGAYCYLISANHHYERRDIPIREQGFTGAPITIGDDAWLGTHVVVLPGVTVGTGAIVAAGSVVNRDIPPYEVWGGVPARFLKTRPE